MWALTHSLECELFLNSLALFCELQVWVSSSTPRSRPHIWSFARWLQPGVPLLVTAERHRMVVWSPVYEAHLDNPPASQSLGLLYYASAVRAELTKMTVPREINSLAI